MRRRVSRPCQYAKPSTFCPIIKDSPSQGASFFIHFSCLVTILFYSLTRGDVNGSGYFLTESTHLCQRQNCDNDKKHLIWLHFFFTHIYTLTFTHVLVVWLLYDAENRIYNLIMDGKIDRRKRKKQKRLYHCGIKDLR